MRSLIAAALFTLVSVSPALAGLTFCNKADAIHSVSVAYKEGDVWRSEGWWNIAPGECKLVVGGDLKQRYYYYRATSPGRTFEDATFHFCTLKEVFTILGEQGNCKPRGYASNGFRKLDTGASAKDFTLNLVPANGPSPTAKPTPEPALKTSTTAPGTYGEPYSDNAVMQDCVTEAEQPYCTFHSGGTKFFVYDDGRTPQSVISAMMALNLTTPITVTGDLVEVFDSTAEVVLREITRRSASDTDGYLDKLQGYWYSVEDPNAQFNILGSERENQYDGEIGGTDYLSVQEHCDRFSGSGPYLYAREEDSQEYYCYVIDYIDELSMTLMYLPNGNFLEYRKLD